MQGPPRRHLGIRPEVNADFQRAVRLLHGCRKRPRLRRRGLQQPPQNVPLHQDQSLRHLLRQSQELLLPLHSPPHHPHRTLALTIVKETTADVAPDEPKEESTTAPKVPFFGQMIGAFKELQRSMLVLLLVTCLKWIAWFPFLLFDPDWMGKEVYCGQVGKGRLYDLGVRAGSLGILLNSVLLGFMSLGVDHLGRWVGGVKRLWAVVNFLLAVCMALTVLITKLAEASRHGHIGVEPPLPPAGIKAGALSLFAVLGIPLAMFVSVVSGPWEDLFGGGNLPAFVAGSVAAVASGMLALFMLPSPPPDLPSNKNARAPVVAFH